MIDAPMNRDAHLLSGMSEGTSCETSKFWRAESLAAAVWSGGAYGRDPVFTDPG